MMSRCSFPALAVIVSLAFAAISNVSAAPLGIDSFTTNGVLSWTNAVVPGVCTVESSYNLDGTWAPVRNSFTTNVTGVVSIPLLQDAACYRLRAVDVRGTPEGFTNLVYSYGLLETLVGTGIGQTDGVSYWQTWYEDGPAQW